MVKRRHGKAPAWLVFCGHFLPLPAIYTYTHTNGQSKQLVHIYIIMNTTLVCRVLLLLFCYCQRHECDAAVTNTEQLVREQYERFPFPNEDPATFGVLHVQSRLSDFATANHYAFGGLRTLPPPSSARPFRVLIAGCGTGTSVEAWALQLSAWAPGSDVVAVDLSAASLAITKQRLDASSQHMQRVNVTLLRASITNLPRSTLGSFDFINCVGVLHHLKDPLAGLNALRRHLYADGGMVIMMYAPYGRAGVYAVQNMARLVVESSTRGRLSGEVIALVRDVLRELPAGHALRLFRSDFNSPGFADDLNYLDENIVDDFLHAQDTSYTVAQLSQLVRDAGMRMTSFATPVVYDPREYALRSQRLVSAFDNNNNMTWIKRAEFAEHFLASFRKHTVFLVLANNTVALPTLRDNNNNNALPMLRAFCEPSAAAAQLRDYSQAEELSSLFVFDYTPADEATKSNYIRTQRALRFRFPLPKHAADIVELCDGQHTVSDIALRLGNRLRLHPKVIRTEIEQLVTSLIKMGRMTIAFAKLPRGVVPVNEAGADCKWNFVTHS